MDLRPLSCLLLCLAASGCASDSTDDQVRDAVFAYMDAMAAGDAKPLPGDGADLLTGPLSFRDVREESNGATAVVARDGAVASVRLERGDGNWRVVSTTLNQAPLQVEDGAMLPLYNVGHRVTIKLTGDTAPNWARGDVVLYRVPAGDGRCAEPGDPAMCERPAPADGTRRALARVVGLPGDEIAMQAGTVVVDGVTQDLAPTIPCPTVPQCDFPEAITVPEGSLFLLADNRPAAIDSRFFGPVRDDAIEGRVVEP